MRAPVMAGAEPWSAEGGPNGALVLHGFTGNPHSMRQLAEAFAKAGFAVELPLLPGHGTSVEDMIATGWEDWSACAEDALGRLAARCPEGRIVVAGLSMGGALTVWLGGRHPELAGLVCINAAVAMPDGTAEQVRAMLEAGTTLIDGIGSDIADPDATELSYAQTPLAPLLSMLEAAPQVIDALGRISCPVIVMTSPQDHVVRAPNSDLIASSVKGPVERVSLERSYHVATLDYDRELIETSAVAFARRVTGQ